MIQRRLVFVNVITSVFQVVFTTGILFFLYRYMIGKIGIERMGVWSLVMSASSILNISNFGFSGSLVKFVAKYHADLDYQTISRLIQTALLSLVFAITPFWIISYFAIQAVFHWVIPAPHLPSALSILPFALVTYWLGMINGVYLSGIDGLQLTHIRSILLTVGAGLFFLLTLILVPRFLLLGLVYAQIVQTLIVLFLSWLMLRRHVPRLPLFPFHWSRKLFSEIFSYSLNFQVISISNLLYDPITKVLLAKFGNLSFVGFYEMANRMIQQFRAVIVNANQVLVPTIAHVFEKRKSDVLGFCRSLNGTNLFISAPVFAALIAFSPYISEIWIGRYETAFVSASVLLAIFWFINTLTLPVYFTNLGTGDIRWNTYGHLLIGMLNLMLGILLGIPWGGLGVVIGWGISLMSGSLLILWFYMKKERIGPKSLFPKEGMSVVLLSIGVALLPPALYHTARHWMGWPWLPVIAASLFFGLIGMGLWRNPLRTVLQNWILSVRDSRNRE